MVTIGSNLAFLFCLLVATFYWGQTFGLSDLLPAFLLLSKVSEFLMIYVCNCLCVCTWLNLSIDVFGVGPFTGLYSGLHCHI